MAWFVQKSVEGWGKLRRFYLVHFRKRYVAEQLQKRQGACARCGDCCSIMFRCPYLDGENHCTIYERRMIQCRYFPMDARDLAYRASCGFRFEESE